MEKINKYKGDNFEKKQPNKTSFVFGHPVIIAIIMALLLFIDLINVGRVNFLRNLEDNTDNTNIEIVRENMSIESLISYHVVEATENIADTGIVEFSLTEYEMNQILYAVSQKIHIPKCKLKSIYVEFLDDEYKMYIPLTIMDIETLVSCSISLYEENDIIHIGIKNFHIGKLHNITIKTVLNLIGVFVKEALSEYDVEMEIQNGEVNASVSRAGLRNIIDELTSKEPLNELIVVAYNVLFLETDAVKLNITNPNDFSIIVNLGCFGGEKSEHNSSYSDVEGLPNAGENISEAGAKISSVALNSFNEYMSGLDEIIDSIPWWEHLIPGENVELLKNYLNENNLFGLTTESALQSYIDALSIEGTVAFISSDINNKVFFLLVEDTVLEITNQGLKLHIFVNVNGYVIPVTVKLKIDNKYLNDLSFTISNICVGNSELTDASVYLMCRYINSVFNTDWIYFIGSKIYVEISPIIMELFDVPFSEETLNSLLKCVYISTSNDESEACAHFNFSIDTSKIAECLEEIATNIFNDCLEELGKKN